MSPNRQPLYDLLALVEANPGLDPGDLQPELVPALAVAERRGFIETRTHTIPPAAQSPTDKPARDLKAGDYLVREGGIVAAVVRVSDVNIDGVLADGRPFNYRKDTDESGHSRGGQLTVAVYPRQPEMPRHVEQLFIAPKGDDYLDSHPPAPSAPAQAVSPAPAGSVAANQDVVRYKQLDEIPARHWNDGNRSGELVTRAYIRKRYHISTATVTAYMEPTSQRDAILITRAKFGREDIFDYREVESMSDVCDEMKRQQVK